MGWNCKKDNPHSLTSLSQYKGSDQYYISRWKHPRKDTKNFFKKLILKTLLLSAKRHFWYPLSGICFLNKLKTSETDVIFLKIQFSQQIFWKLIPCEQLNVCLLTSSVCFCIHHRPALSQSEKLKTFVDFSHELSQTDSEKYDSQG